MLVGLLARLYKSQKALFLAFEFVSNGRLIGVVMYEELSRAWFSVKK
jgi:hypothetical protein